MLSISKIKIISVTCLQSGSIHIKTAQCNAAFQGSLYTWASIYLAYRKKLILPEAQATSRGGVTFKLSSDAGQKKKKRADIGLRLLSLERPAYKWPLDAVWEFDWHIGPYTDGTLLLNDKDGS